jgi:guanine nucleotide-binding protein G(I)/G(S)/G(T) subunit beta-1
VLKERDFHTRRILTGHYNSVQCIDWSGDNQRIVSASQSGNVVIWDGILGRKLNRIRFDMKWLLTCSFTKSTTGDMIAAGGLDNCCSIFQCPIYENEEEGLPSGKKVAKLTGHGGYMSSCPFLKGDDSKILTGCGDGIVRLWNVESGKKISELKEHTKDISCVSVLDNNIFTASSYDGTCSIWDLRSSSVVHRYYGKGTNILTVNMHPSGKGIAAGFENGIVSYYDLRAMAELVKFSLVTNDSEEEGAEGAKVDGTSAPVQATPAPAPPAPAAGGEENKQEGGASEEPPEVKSVCFSNNGRFLYVAYKCEVLEWDLLTGQSVSTMPHPGLVSDCKISPDGVAVATACWDSMVRVWTP